MARRRFREKAKFGDTPEQVRDGRPVSTSSRMIGHRKLPATAVGPFLHAVRRAAKAENRVRLAVIPDHRFGILGWIIANP